MYGREERLEDEKAEGEVKGDEGGGERNLGVGRGERERVVYYIIRNRTERSHYYQFWESSNTCVCIVRLPSHSKEHVQSYLICTLTFPAAVGQ